MKRERTQLNINIDPALLVNLKAEAIKNGKTLTEYVTGKLQGSSESIAKESLEERLIKIEKHLFQENKNTLSNPVQNPKSIFSDEGAKYYGELSRSLFIQFADKKGLQMEEALEDFAKILPKYPLAHPELIFQILLGNHCLTGEEMTMAYRNGSCALRSALNEWTDDSLEPLNVAFLNAVSASSTLTR